MKKNILLSLILILFGCMHAMADTDITNVPNTLYFEPVTIQAGETGKVHVCMKNNDVVQTIGAWFYLPKGMKVKEDEEGLYVYSSGDRDNRLHPHSCGANYVVQNDVYKMYLLQSGAAFKGNDGEVFTVEVEVDKDLAPGDYTMKFAEIEFSNATAPLGILVNHVVFEGTITVTSPTGIIDINADGTTEGGEIYDINGIRSGKIHKGFNLIKQRNGEVIKIAK